MIPYGRQHVTDADIAAVVEVLRSDFLTQGPAVPRFEQVLADRVRARHAIAVNSATSALHVACLALDLGPDDWLWTTPNTFVASANCGLYCGANVDFVDIDPLTWNMSPAALEEKLAVAARKGSLPKVVVPVHFGGQPTAQEAIWELAGKYGFKVLEDASHSIGATHNQEVVGSCRWSHATVFSFHPVKIVTSAEGGAISTNDPEIATRLALLRSHGVTRDPTLMESVSPGAWYYEQIDLGFNYRMTDLQAALGLSQMARLDDYVDSRNRLASRYDEAFRQATVRTQKIDPGNRSAFHLYVIRVDADSRRATFDALRACGIGVNVHYMPVHLQPYYRRIGFTEGQFPEAESHGREAITLPLYPGLREKDQDLVIEAVNRLAQR